MLEGQVDHAVGVDRRLGQAFGIIEVTAVHLGPGRLELLGRGVGTGQADHLMACLEQLGHDGRADPP